jgi:hypothetical protein
MFYQGINVPGIIGVACNTSVTIINSITSISIDQLNAALTSLDKQLRGPR